MPLPLFVTFCLLILLIRFIRQEDLRLQSNQLFALLIALFALQSLLLCLRWGYGYEAMATFVALSAPLLPVVAYLAYRSLRGPLRLPDLWPLGGVVVMWADLLLAVGVFDALLIALYIGLGIALVLQTRTSEALGLVRISRATDAARAMTVTGLLLCAMGVMDIFVIVDFLRTGGQNIGFQISLAQALFLLGIGLAAGFSQASPTERRPALPDTDTDAEEPDTAIIQRLETLFESDGLHLDPDLNLRRMARRLGVPDRSVSRAINRARGINVSQFVNSYRIETAKRMLCETDQSILQISLAAGFLSKSNFNREFARLAGRTPSQWRKEQTR